MTTYSGLSLGHLLLLYQKSGQNEQCRKAPYMELKIGWILPTGKRETSPWSSISPMRI